MEDRQARHLAITNLPEDMEFLKKKVTALMEHTGLQDDEEDVEGGAKEAETNDAPVKEDDTAGEEEA